jgi:hypothetical protein
VVVISGTDTMRCRWGSGEEPARPLRSARLFQAYERMFWDAMAEAAKVA